MSMLHIDIDESTVPDRRSGEVVCRILKSSCEKSHLTRLTAAGQLLPFGKIE